jgi:hypothetical protein
MSFSKYDLPRGPLREDDDPPPVDADILDILDYLDCAPSTYGWRSDEDSGPRGRDRVLANNLRDYLGGSITEESWFRVLEAYNRKCAYCGSAKNIELDHIDPLAKGGRSAPDNIAPACKPCNRDKSSKSLEAWLGRAEAAHFRRTHRVILEAT